MVAAVQKFDMFSRWASLETEVPGYPFPVPGGVPVNKTFKTGTAPYSTSVQSVSANSTSITIDGAGVYTFNAVGNEFPSGHDQGLGNTRAEIQVVERMPSTMDIWMAAEIYWDGNPPPDWALFMQIQQNGTDNLLNPSTPIWNIEVDTGFPNTLAVVQRHQVTAGDTVAVTNVLARKTITPNTWVQVVMFARLTKGELGGIGKAWIGGTQVVDYQGRMGYPVSPANDVGISPRFGCYRAVAAGEDVAPITYTVKIRNWYAGPEGMAHLI